MNRRTIAVSLFIAAGMVTLIAFLVRDLIPLIQAFLDADTNVADYLESFGGRGIPMLIGLQVMQIIVPIIPAASIAAISGILYGVWQGMVIILTGRILGNMLMFVAWRRMRSVMARIWVQKEEKQGLISRTLSRVKNPGVAAALLVFMPGIPYGVTPYMFAKTEMPMTQYILAVIIGNLPFGFLYVYMGASVSTGDYGRALALLGAVVVLVIAGLAIRRKFTAKSPDIKYEL